MGFDRNSVLFPVFFWCLFSVPVDSGDANPTRWRLSLEMIVYLDELFGGEVSYFHTNFQWKPNMRTCRLLQSQAKMLSWLRLHRTPAQHHGESPSRWWQFQGLGMALVVATCWKTSNNCYRATFHLLAHDLRPRPSYTSDPVAVVLVGSRDSFGFASS